MHRYAGLIRSEDEAAEAARGAFKKKEPVASRQAHTKLEIAVEDVPTTQLSGLDPEQFAPPSPSPGTSSFGLDEEELLRGLSDDDEDSGSETAGVVVTAEEGVPPSRTASGVPTGANLAEEVEWDDV